MPPANPKFTVNNFDLIRLLAAMQVVVVHILTHLQPFPGAAALVSLLESVPGVPIFFLISGFLISRSYENCSTLKGYFRNRALRIYPALWLCTGLSALSVFIIGYLPPRALASGSFWAWLGAQGTIVQFYNPDFLRHYGVGVLNGSLWTISVELQFYLIIPLLYWGILRRFEKKRATLLILGIMILFGGVNYYEMTYAGDGFFGKLLGVSFGPWLYMFLTGVLVQIHWSAIGQWFYGRALSFVAGYLALVMGLKQLGVFHSGNGITPVSFFALSGAVLACAYSAPTLSERLLRRNDFSYGVYIYQMPIINALIYLGYKQNLWSLPLAGGLVLAMAAVSWFSVERPCLRLKKRTLHTIK